MMEYVDDLLDVYGLRGYTHYILTSETGGRPIMTISDGCIDWSAPLEDSLERTIQTIADMMTTPRPPFQRNRNARP